LHACASNNKFKNSQRGEALPSSLSPGSIELIKQEAGEGVGKEKLMNVLTLVTKLGLSTSHFTFTYTWPLKGQRKEKQKPCSANYASHSCKVKRGEKQLL
jgi:hypothetical protein